MLVIKAEIWPKGDVDSRFEIGRIGIINRDRPGFLADYDVVALLARDSGEYIMRDVVTGHDRRDGWRPLTAAALTVTGWPSGTYDLTDTQRITDLLKRG